jgi:hypothetical protein
MIDSFTPVNPALIDQPLDPSLLTNNTPGHDPRGDTVDAKVMACGAASREFPQALWIEPKDRPDKARENDKYHTWGLNYVDRFTNQTPTHECTCHDLRTGAEAAYNKQRGIIFPDGPKKDFRYEDSAKGAVWLSPLSIYAEANPRQWGGAGCFQVLDIACSRGFLPDKIQPRDYGFKHYLQGTAGKGGKNQSSGPWVPLSQFPDGWQETAGLLRPDQVIVTSDPDQALCLLLWGYVLACYARDGHAIPPAIWNPVQDIYGYVDSYDVLRWDSASKFRSACRSGVAAITSMKPPDNWNNPAGVAL